MDMASSSPDMPAMYRGLFIQPSAIQQQLNLPSSSPSWLSCYTHVLLSSLLWLEIYCFQLNFWILLRLSVSSFEKSILRTLLVTKIRILINLLPLSSRYAYSLFSSIFNHFPIFLDFQQAWTNFMIPNNGIHWINSCKSNMDFGGGPTFLISSLILILKMIVWYLVDFLFSLMTYMNSFYIYCWDTLVPIDVWMLANQVRFLYPPTLKFYEYVCYHEPWPCLMP